MISDFDIYNNTYILMFARFEFIPVNSDEENKYGSVQAGLNQIIRKV